MILAIDPGPMQSAYVAYQGRCVLEHGLMLNCELVSMLSSRGHEMNRMAVEMVACYGKPVGVDVFDTVLWIGRFWERWVTRPGNSVHLVYRRDVKLHLCDSLRGVTDANIRQALIDKFGPGKDKAVGRKATPGPLYGIKSHEWAALAVAVTWWDTMRGPNPSAMPCPICGPADACRCA